MACVPRPSASSLSACAPGWRYHSLMLSLRTSLGVVAMMGVALAANACSGGDETGGSTSATSGSGGATSSSASSMSMASSSSSSGSMASSGSGMIACDEKYTSIPVGECDLLQQNCAAGSFCAVAKVDGKSSTKCVPDQGGIKDKGAECTTNSECKGGLSCVDKHCSPFCCPSNNEPCGGGSCDVNLSFDGDTSVFVMTCSYSPSCDLFAGNCAMGTECHMADATACLAVCDAPSDMPVSEGGKCQYRNDCGDSQICNKNQPDDGVCRYFCNPKNAGAAAGKGGCPSGQQCKPISGTGCNDLGICIPM